MLWYDCRKGRKESRMVGCWTGMGGKNRLVRVLCGEGSNCQTWKGLEDQLLTRVSPNCRHSSHRKGPQTAGLERPSWKDELSQKVVSFLDI